MWTARYFNPRYWASRFWAKSGADAGADVCGVIIGADTAYYTIEGGIADYQISGDTTAYVTITGGDEECQ